MTTAAHCRLAISLTFATVALALLSFATLARAEAPRGCATVEVQNLRAGQGPLMLAAYSEAASGVTRVNLLDARQLVNGPVTQATLQCGFHGNFTTV